MLPQLLQMLLVYIPLYLKKRAYQHVCISLHKLQMIISHHKLCIHYLIQYLRVTYLDLTTAYIAKSQVLRWVLKWPPSYANCFMHQLETSFLETQEFKPIFWRRYIDDILMLWTHSKEQLQTFLEDLNSFHPTIHFTWDISDSKVTFLDLEIYKGPHFKNTHHLDITTHFKKTNTFQYLHYMSCHPRSTFKGIVKGEAVRFIRSNTDETNYNQILKKFIKHLTFRGYPKQFIYNSLSNIRYSNRDQYLTPRSKSQTEIPRFIIQFSPHYSSLALWLAEHWHIILEDKHLAQIFNRPPQICYKKNRCISNVIVRANLSKEPLPISTSLSPLTPQHIHKHTLIFSCTDSHCITCSHLCQQTSISSIYTLHSFSIKQTISCFNSNIVYCLKCIICSKLYVGKTAPLQTLKDRHFQHIQSSKDHTKKNWPLYSHFANHKSNFEDNHLIIPVQKCNPKFLTAMERIWITKLQTLIPSGLNHCVS